MREAWDNQCGRSLRFHSECERGRSRKLMVRDARRCGRLRRGLGAALRGRLGIPFPRNFCVRSYIGGSKARLLSRGS